MQEESHCLLKASADILLIFSDSAVVILRIWLNRTILRRILTKSYLYSKIIIVF